MNPRFSFTAVVSTCLLVAGTKTVVSADSAGGVADNGAAITSAAESIGEPSVSRPNPNPELDLGTEARSIMMPCNSVDDCTPDFGVVPLVDCIPAADGTFPGTCYTSANRYLSIAPNPDNTGPTARRISLDINDNDTFDPGVDYVLGWVDDPFATTVIGPEPSPQAQARVSATPVYRDWNDLSDVDPAFVGTVPVHVGDCEITPKGAPPNIIGNAYFLQAINLGSDEFDETSYSTPLRLRTVVRYTDVNGTGIGTRYPNNAISLAGAFAMVLGFQGNQQVPKWRLDQTGGQSSDNVPDFATVSLLDVFDMIRSKSSGGQYAYQQPCDCPGQSCP